MITSRNIIPRKITIAHSLSIGERYDFVINADQPAGAYWIQVRSLGECGIPRAQQLGILRYARGPYQPTSAPPSYDFGLPQGVVSTRLFFTLKLSASKTRLHLSR